MKMGNKIFHRQQKKNSSKETIPKYQIIFSKSQQPAPRSLFGDSKPSSKHPISF